jgi:hypothetical protein
MHYDSHRNRRRNIRRWFSIQQMAEVMGIEPSLLAKHLERLRQIHQQEEAKGNRQHDTTTFQVW